MTDFCYSRPIFDRVMRQAALMDRMMRRVGADRNAAVSLDGGSAWFEARLKCIACRREPRCLEWLAHAQAALPSDPPQFCHNVAFFRRCKEAAVIGPPPLHTSVSNSTNGETPWLPQQL
jgi:hypothetical protein